MTYGFDIERSGFVGSLVGRVSSLSVMEGTLATSFPAHIAEADELAIVLAGVLDVTLDGTTRRLGAGEYVLIPKGTAHGVDAVEPCRLLLIGS